MIVTINAIGSTVSCLSRPIWYKFGLLAIETLPVGTAGTTLLENNSMIVGCDDH